MHGAPGSVALDANDTRKKADLYVPLVALLARDAPAALIPRDIGHQRDEGPAGRLRGDVGGASSIHAGRHRTDGAPHDVHVRIVGRSTHAGKRPTEAPGAAAHQSSSIAPPPPSHTS